MKILNAGDGKANGLADVETGSCTYLSEFLDYDQEEGDECDETTEEDLIYLKDISTSFELVVKLFLIINKRICLNNSLTKSLKTTMNTLINVSSSC
jgi:hypothetical protein